MRTQQLRVNRIEEKKEQFLARFREWREKKQMSYLQMVQGETQDLSDKAHLQVCFQNVGSYRIPRAHKMRNLMKIMRCQDLK